ncbi:MAG: glycosyltransferase family 9 protein [Fimbriimonadales bacterium]
MARYLGIEVPRIEPLLAVTERERGEGGVLAQGATVAIQPGARHDYKRVPTDYLAGVAEELRRRGYGIVLLGGIEEASAGEALAGRLSCPAVNLIGITTIRQTLSVLANVRAAVGSDTGVMHLAAGLGIPTVTAFGPTSAIKWGHHYAPHQVLQSPHNDLSQLDPVVLVQATLRALGEA